MPTSIDLRGGVVPSIVHEIQAGAGISVDQNTNTVTVTSTSNSLLPFSYTIYKTGTTINALDGSNGSIVFSSTIASTVINQCIDALTGGGRVFIKSGTYYLNAEIYIAIQGVTLEGEGCMDATVLVPEADINVIHIEPSASWLYHNKISNLKIHDFSTVTSSGGGIYLDNYDNNLAFPTIDNVRITNTAKGLYSATSFADQGNMINTPRFYNLTFEHVRGYNIYMNNVIDMRMSDIWCGISESLSTSVIEITNPIVRSVGHFIERVTILNSTVSSDGIVLENCNEAFLKHIIVDSVDGIGLRLDDSSRNRFVDVFLLSGGSHGVYIEDNSEWNYFERLISQSNSGYGIVDDTSAMSPQIFRNVWVSNNTLGAHILTSADVYPTYAPEFLPTGYTISNYGLVTLASGETLTTNLATVPTHMSFISKDTVPADFSWNTIDTSGSILVYHNGSGSLTFSWEGKV